MKFRKESHTESVDETDPVVESGHAHDELSWIVLDDQGKTIAFCYDEETADRVVKALELLWKALELLELEEGRKEARAQAEAE